MEDTGKCEIRTACFHTHTHTIFYPNRVVDQETMRPGRYCGMVGKNSGTEWGWITRVKEIKIRRRKTREKLWVKWKWMRENVLMHTVRKCELAVGSCTFRSLCTFKNELNKRKWTVEISLSSCVLRYLKYKIICQHRMQIEKTFTALVIWVFGADVWKV